MSFLSTVKKAFGFSNELDEDEMIEFTDDNTTAPSDSESSVPRVEHMENTVEQIVPQTPEDDSLPGDIFDAIIKLFNEFQPEFIASCLNTKQQKQYIYNHIDEAVKQRLQLAMNHARAKASRETSESHSKMTADIARLRELNASLEAKKDEFQSEKLSASRQKRALNERVHDLEAQINNLEAEKEQYQLENRSLINKLRVASVTASCADSEQLAQENITLKDQIQELQKQIEETQNTTHTTDNESDTELNALMQKVEQFETVKQRLDSRIADLTSQLANANDHISLISKDLELSQSDNNSLRKTIETNLYAQAQSENELKSKIADLTAKLEKSTAATSESTKTEHNTKPTRRKSKKRPVISAIDDLMENTDWFVAQEPTPIKKGSDSEDDFGYKEPTKKPNSKDDDKQLSLF
ncbi:MAG: hypothetical protein K2O88_09355 [Paramuribaculum sp.]|nr:hypothetical protein [Paramuribaculum sp.]